MSVADLNPRTEVHAVTELMRQLVKSGADYSKRLGSSLELNPTDLKVMEQLMELGEQTPTQLAKAVGITTGALTQALDRLELQNHTSRIRSETDRRSLVVKPNPETVRRAWLGINPLTEASEKLLAQMSEAEKQAVRRFISGMIAAYQSEADDRSDEVFPEPKTTGLEAS
jgi:Transcriptional regulators